MASFMLAQLPASAQTSPQFSAWWWSDKYVYMAGESATIRITANANGDNKPYTAFFYLQNNQTGKKLYLPGGTEEAVDFTGRTKAQGYTISHAGTVSKFVMMGDGGYLPKVALPQSELGMFTIVGEWRDETASRVVKALYMKIAVVSEIVNVSGAINSNTTWVNTKSYILNGIVPVNGGATLTIEPGTIVRGAPGSLPPSALLVTREGKIIANGTRSRPIIMTSMQPFGQRGRGDWGGLVLLGKAPINVGANTNSQSNPEGSFYVEGLVANPDGLYGGTDPNHDCGTLRYVRVEYAGSILSPNNELNAFTWAGCGKATVSDHLQSIYGLDDAFEWFGGNNDAKYLVGGLAADDYVDFQLGYTGRLQYGLFYQSSNSRGNRGIEGDNSEFNNGALPSSDPVMFNMTFLGSGQPGFDEANAPGIFLRRGARGTFNNMAVLNFYSGGLEITDANTQAQMDLGNIKMNGLLLWNNNIGLSGAPTIQGQVPHPVTQAYAEGTRGGGTSKNFSVEDPAMIHPLELSDPDWRGMIGSPLLSAGAVAPPDDGFFDQAGDFIGGIGEVNWTEEWTSFLQETDLVP